MAKPKLVVIDEVHVTVRVPGELPEDAAEAVRKALGGDPFMSRMRQAVRAVLREFSELNAARVSLTR